MKQKMLMLNVITTHPKAITLGIGLAIAAAIGIGLGTIGAPEQAYAGGNSWGGYRAWQKRTTHTYTYKTCKNQMHDKIRSEEEKLLHFVLCVFTSKS